MWPFKKRNKKAKSAESIEKKDIPLEKTYTHEAQHQESEDPCAKEAELPKMLLTDEEEEKLLNTFAEYRDKIIKAQDELAKRIHVPKKEKNT